MMILLNILKWIGIVLLVLLVILIILLLIVLITPFHYKAAGRVDDPDTHEEFPVSVLKERSEVNAEVSWLLGAVKVLVRYPRGELLRVKLFGKDLGIMRLLKKKEEAPEKEEKEEKQEEEKEEDKTPLEDKIDNAVDMIEKILDIVDYVHRVLTGVCGRRAIEKIKTRLGNIVSHVLPRNWSLRGKVGLSDPCVNGTVSGACAMLLPLCEDHLRIRTQWQDYQFDIRGEISGEIRLGVPVIQVVPLIFDRDFRKLVKKLLRVRTKIQSALRRKEEGNG